MSKITVVGAGMTGLLTGAMLRNECAHIIDAQPSLPNNHSAVLRFRSSVVGDVLGIPFKEVTVMKCVNPWLNPVADALAYSRKTNGTATLRSSISANGEIGKRYIAPPDFINRMGELVADKLRLNLAFSFQDYMKLLEGDIEGTTPIISTIPMPMLMNALGWPTESKFDSRPGRHIIVELAGVDAYCSVYDPDPNSPISRVSITGAVMHIECHSKSEASEKAIVLVACEICGLSNSNIITWQSEDQRYAKILPIDEAERRRFIVWASETFKIYSVGRFATWRPNLLLDDVVNDVRVIKRLINGESRYDHRKKV